MGAVKQKDKVQSQKNGGECKPERTVGLLQAADDNPREIEVAKAFVQRVSDGEGTGVCGRFAGERLAGAGSGVCVRFAGESPAGETGAVFSVIFFIL